MNARQRLSAAFALAVLCTASGFAHAAGATIGGRITQQKTGAPLIGAAVTFSAGGGSAMTDSNGVYTLVVPAGWSGTATPSYGTAGTFSPQSRRYNKVKSDRLNQNYLWKPTPALAISGRVILADVETPVAGVVVAFAGLGSATTDTNGLYSFVVPTGWSGTASASFAGGGRFSPATRRYTKVKSAKPQQGYVWHAPALLTTAGSATWYGTNATAVLALPNLLTVDTAGVTLLYPVADPADATFSATANVAAIQGVLGVDPTGVTLVVVHITGGTATVEALVPGTTVTGTVVLQVEADWTSLLWDLELTAP
jgi:hypothetical protein